MIDLHNHILPGVDDGAVSVEVACAMARDLVAQGITTVCTTPHTTDLSKLVDTADVRQRVAALQRVLDEEGIGLRLLPGSEARIAPTLVQDVQSGKVPTINGTSYLLLEFPYDSLPPFYERLIFELQVHGIRPIIAHPERIAPIADEPNILFQLVHRGCLAQLTAASLAGAFGPKPREVSEQMLEHNLIHVVASDAHACDERLSAVADARRACGARADELWDETPATILAGEPIHTAEPLEIKRRRFLGVF